MTTQIEILAREKLGRVDVSAIIQKELALDRPQSQTAIENSIKNVCAHLRNAAGMAGHRQHLYDTVTRADSTIGDRFLHEREREAALADASTQLRSLVGSDGSQTLLTQLTGQTRLSDKQANSALGFASTAIIDSLAEQMNHSLASDDAAGVAALLNAQPGQRTIAPRAYGSGQSSAAIGATAVTASEKSPWKRYLVPLLLLAALLLSTLKYCSEAEKNRASNEERETLQKEVTGLQQEAASNNEKLLSLQSDYDTAQSDAASLASDLEASRSELATLRDVPTDTAELQRTLQTASQQRDDALERATQIEVELATVTADRDEAAGIQQTLQDELQTAKRTITDSEATIDNLQAQVDSVTAERDQSASNLTSTAEALDNEKALRADENAAHSEQTSDLNARLVQSQSAITERDGQIESLTNDVQRLEGELSSTRASLEDERTGRSTDTERLSLQSDNLQTELTQLAGLRDSAELKLQEQQAELDQQLATITELQQQLEQLEETSTQATERSSELDVQLQQLKTDYAAAQATIESNEASLASNAEALQRTEGDLDTRTGELQSLTATNQELQQQLADLTAQNAEQQQQIDRQDEGNTSLTSELRTTESRLSDAQKTNAELETALIDTRDELTQISAAHQQAKGDVALAEEKIGTLTRRAAELESEIGTLQQQIDTLSDELETGKSSNTELRQSLDQLTQDQKALQQQHSNAVDKIDTLEQTLAGSEDELAKVGRERESLQSQIDQRDAQASAKTQNAQTVRDEIRQALADAGVDEVDVAMADDGRAVALSLGSGSVFQIGNVAISRRGAEVLNEVGDIIGTYPDWHIDVEGHTDSLPIGEKLSQRYPSNWELSSARASAVVNYLLLTHKVKADGVSARGFADTRPIADNHSASTRVKNRRVDLVLRAR
jgi:chemotaxis protein MotB